MQIYTSDRTPFETCSQVGTVQPGRLITCLLDDLRPHPVYVRHSLSVAVDRLSHVAKLGNGAFQNPLVITTDRVVLDGYARWELARRKGRSVLDCIEYDLTEDQALQLLIQLHGRSGGLNDFCRILLALDLEPLLREAARANQRAGGERKASSNLTEAQRLDVRQELARIAGVSVGNVSKVKAMLGKAAREIVVALKNGEVRIHRASQWCRLSLAEQRAALEQYRSQRGVSRTIRVLISRHQQKNPPVIVNRSDLVYLLRQLESRVIEPISVCVIDTPGRTIFLTKDLAPGLGA